MPKTFNPGEKAKDSGQYEIVGPRGGKTGVERTVTKGEPLPPTTERRRGKAAPPSEPPPIMRKK